MIMKTIKKIGMTIRNFFRTLNAKDNIDFYHTACGDFSYLPGVSTQCANLTLR